MKTNKKIIIRSFKNKWHLISFSLASTVLMLSIFFCIYGDNSSISYYFLASNFVICSYLSHRLWKNCELLILDRQGLHHIYFKGKVSIAWDNIEQISLYRAEDTEIMGVRLKHYKNILNQLHDDVSMQLKHYISALFMMTLKKQEVHCINPAADLLNADAVKVVVTAEQIAYAIEDLKTSEIHICMLAARRYFGCDLSLGEHRYAGSAAELVTIIDHYRLNLKA